MPGGHSSRPLPSLRLRRIRALVLLVAVVLVAWAGVHVIRSGAEDASVAEPSVTTQPRVTTKPSVTAKPPVTTQSPAAAEPSQPPPPPPDPTPPPPTAESAAAALAEAVGRRTAGVDGRTAVSVTDLTTGVTASYGKPDRKFATASIVKVDILATLLLQEKGRLSAGQRSAARRMIQQSDNGAATTLWRQIGRAEGLAAANQELGLTGTTGGRAGYWGTTTTTAADQQRLLHVIFTDDSPLNAKSRTYLKELMGGVVADQDWGVSAADTRRGSKFSVKNGWLPRSKGWVLNSIGAVEHNGHDLLIVALSDGRTSMPEGVRVIERVSTAAARAVSGV